MTGATPWRVLGCRSAFGSCGSAAADGADECRSSAPLVERSPEPPRPVVEAVEGAREVERLQKGLRKAKRDPSSRQRRKRGPVWNGGAQGERDLVLLL